MLGTVVVFQNFQTQEVGFMLFSFPLPLLYMDSELSDLEFASGGL